MFSLTFIFSTHFCCFILIQKKLSLTKFNLMNLLAVDFSYKSFNCNSILYLFLQFFFNLYLFF